MAREMAACGLDVVACGQPAPLWTSRPHSSLGGRFCRTSSLAWEIGGPEATPVRESGPEGAPGLGIGV